MTAVWLRSAPKFGLKFEPDCRFTVAWLAGSTRCVSPGGTEKVTAALAPRPQPGGKGGFGVAAPRHTEGGSREVGVERRVQQPVHAADSADIEPRILQGLRLCTQGS